MTGIRTFAIVLLVELSVALAHSQSTSPGPIGVLGQRYAEISGGQIEPTDDLFDRTKAGGIRINVPLPTTIDLNFGYTFSRAIGTTMGGTLLNPPADVTTRQNMAHAAATGYLRYAAVAPFIRAAVEYQWSKSERVYRNFRVEQSESDTVWVIGAGAEILVYRVAVTPAISYRSTYRNEYGNDRGGEIVFGIDAHLWFTRSFGGFARIDAHRPTDGGQTWAGDIGLRFRF